MLYLCLLAGLGLALADTSPLCGGDCPADWKKVEGDCVMFLYGWEEDSARQVCRGLEAEYSEFFISRSDSNNATHHSLPVCLLSRETPAHNDSEERKCDTEPCPPVPGFIISGGKPDSSLKKVEVYNPSSGNSCPVQDLQEARWGHTSCSGLVCGGQGSSSLGSCEKISGTEVSPQASLTLRQGRAASLCWSLPGGNKTLLLGGWLSRNTSEVVSGSSSTAFTAFTLPYTTNLACGIEVGDHYVVTGGRDGSAPGYALSTVANYSQSGLVEYLPSLNTRRFSHACSSFISDSGETVLLVTGGGHEPGGAEIRLDSTEILDGPSRSWRTLTTARLPSARWALQAGTVNNIVFIFGGDDGSHLNTILSFNKTEESWQPAGQMTVRRSYHGVEVAQDVSKHCP